jgi:hypothetical protein
MQLTLDEVHQADGNTGEESSQRDVEVEAEEACREADASAGPPIRTGSQPPA